MQDVLWHRWLCCHLTRVQQQHMLQVLVSHFGLNNSRGVKLLRLCRVWRRICCQLPVASCPWPVGATSCHCCCPFPPTLTPVQLPAKHCHSAHAKHPLHLHELPRLLSLFRRPLPAPYLLLSDCPQKAAEQKIEFPVRTDSIWRCNFTLCYCKVAATAAPGQDCARSHSQSWPKIAIFSYGGNKKRVNQNSHLVTN